MKQPIAKLGALFVAIGIAGLLHTTPAAFANSLAAGGDVTPDGFGSITGTVLATASGSFTAPAAPPALVSGTYTTEVVRTATGLDFIIQVTNAGQNTIEHVTNGLLAGTYSPYTVDVGTATSAGTLSGGTIAPSDVDMAADGASVSFNFATSFGGIPSGTGPIPVGDTSLVLVIATNAPSFTAGDIGVIDSTAAGVAGFIPVPAPAIGAGIPGLIVACGALIVFGRRRRQKLI